MLAEVGQFPPFFGPSRALGTHAGLLITAGLVLVVANLVDLSAIASVGSAARSRSSCSSASRAIGAAHDTGANAAIVLAAITVTAVVLAFFAVDTLRNEPETFVAIIAIGLLSVILDLIWKRSAPAAAAITPDG